MINHEVFMTSSFLGPKLIFHFYLIHGSISGLAHFIHFFSIVAVKEHLVQGKGQILNLDGTSLASEA